MRHGTKLFCGLRKVGVLKLMLVLVVGAFSIIGCSGDDLTSVFVSGRAFFPLEFRSSLGSVVPVANAPFQVIDLRLAVDNNVVASGFTDANGSYQATFPVTTAAAVIVLGEVRVSGLVDPRRGSLGKDFNGVTDLACEAGVTAVLDGSITADQLDSGRISNLEAGAAVVAAATTVDFTDTDGSRAAAAQVVRQITDNGAHAPQ